MVYACNTNNDEGPWEFYSQPEIISPKTKGRSSVVELVYYAQRVYPQDHKQTNTLKTAKRRWK